jgi:xylulokinase
MYFVGIDIGTSGSKTIVFDEKGNVMGSDYREYGCTYPNPNWVEISGENMIGETLQACKKAIMKSKVDINEIVSIGFSTQRATFGLVDNNGTLIDDTFYSWQDNRATDSVEFMLEKFPEIESVTISGMPVTTTYSASKMIWIKKHQPEKYASIYKMVLIQSYLVKILGADDYYCDRGSAGCTGLLDISEGKWSQRLIDAYELDMDHMPKLVPPADKIGYVSEEGAKLSGLPVGLPLCTGTGDQQCGVIGAGAIRQGMGTMTVGTAGFLISFLDKPALGEPFKSMMSVEAGYAGKYEIEGIMLGAAVNYKWFRDTFCELEKKIGAEKDVDPYVLMEEYVKETTVGANGVITLPHLGTAGCPFWNVEASGVIAGLTFSHTKGDVARSFMEGIILEIRNMYKAMKAADVVFDEIIITGGATKSPTWRQIMADVMNTKVKTLVVSDATVLGAAILGTVAAGIYSSVPECTDVLVRYDKVLEPFEENVRKYDAIFETYLKLYHALDKGGAFSALSKINKGIF